MLMFYHFILIICVSLMEHSFLDRYIAALGQPCLSSGVALDLYNLVSCHLLEETGSSPVIGTAGHDVE